MRTILPWAIALALVTAPGAGSAQEQAALALRIPTMRRSPLVDGRLDDPAWVGAARFTAFKTLRPRPGQPPSQPTEVLLATDAENIYVALRCTDDRPDAMRAVGRREAELLADDWVLFALDTYGDGLAAYFFGVNPAGGRADGTLSWEGLPDLALDLRWRSAVWRDATGYTAELAIPLRSLSHPWSGEARMGFKVARYVSRLEEEADFPEVSPDGGPPLTQMQAVVLTGAPRSTVPATTMIPNHLSPPPTPEGFDLNTLEGRLRAWDGVEVSDYLLFPSEAVVNRGDALAFPAADRAAWVREAWAGLEYRQGRPIGHLEDFLERTATSAFVVVLRDTVICEEYFNGYGRESVVTSFSVAKSFVSTMVGAAVDAGLIGSVHDPITRYLPELEERDPRFARITVEHLLRMSSGMRYVEAPPYRDDAVTYYHPRLREAGLRLTGVEGAPGVAFFYNNYNPLLLGMLLERVTGMTVPRYLQRAVWTPLGMEYPASWSLDSDASGFAKMESGLNARAIDYAKLGRLYLHRGRWGDRQVLTPEWVAAATQPPPGRGFYPHWPQRGAQGGYYGYFWWGRRRGAGLHDFYALGNKGQFIYVSPQADLVIVRTGIEFGVPSGTWIELFYDFTSQVATWTSR